ncbi:MAG: hypothetical protein IJ662_00720 [Clostridia bacterium]|nr:hypothetical protein [Clostridia bacterium]
MNMEKGKGCHCPLEAAMDVVEGKFEWAGRRRRAKKRPLPAAKRKYGRDDLEKACFLRYNSK